MRRVLVTGASGYIGRHSIAPLLNRGFEVHAVSNRRMIESDARVVWHTRDLLDEHVSHELCAEVKPSHLLHFAWYVNPADYKTSPENSRWVGATQALIRAFKESGGVRAILAGTCMEFDWTVPQETLKEDSPLGSTTTYGTTKDQTRRISEKYAAENGLSLAWGRIFFSYGPYEARTRLIPSVILSLLSGEEARCTSGEQVRDFLFVADMADAFTAILDSKVMGTVNIASGKPIALKEIIMHTAEILGRTDLIRLGALTAPSNEPVRLVADIHRLANEVGWSPRHDFESGLQETIQWWKKSLELK